MVDVQRGDIRADDGARDIAAFDIAPCPRIAIDAAMAPTDHRVRAIKIAVWEMFGPDEVA